MFTDQAKIQVQGGHGGNGAVAFRREIYVPAGGPAGGDGGDGGSVIFVADQTLRTLNEYKYKSKYAASSGEDGKSAKMHGKNAVDLVLRVPRGTVIRDSASKLVMADLKNDGDRFVAARGGRGGKGNTHFKTAVRQAPSFAKAGKDGQQRELILELRLIADVGLIGFPNVGKSTLLSVISKARPKIANYHFTTLSPNLGVVSLSGQESFVVADIPGLIEGAHQGIGLGHDFLRHIERTRLLVHLVDISSSEGRDPLEDFEKINQELTLYNPRLAQRPQIVLANKADLLADEESFQTFSCTLQERGYAVYKISAATTAGVQEALRHIAQSLAQIEEEPLFEEEELYSAQDEFMQEPGEIHIHREEDVYVVEGNRLLKLLYSVDFEDMESIRFFQTVLEKTGVFDRLREMGIEDGDTVRIYDLEFEFYE